MKEEKNTSKHKESGESQSSNQMLKLIIDNLPQAIFWKDKNSVYLGCNKKFAIHAGVESPEDIVGKNDYDLPWKKEETELYIDADRRVMETDTPEYHIEEDMLQADGKQAWVETNKIPLHNTRGEVIGILGSYEDITERKLSEEVINLNEFRLEALLDLNQMTEASIREITDFTLEEAIWLSNSKIGYLAFVDEDETLITIHSWSKRALEECAIINKPLVYPVNNLGVLGESVRQRKPVIINDYASHIPNKKGYPNGHVEIIRYLSVPVFDDGRIVAVAGVGNKEDNYSEKDAQQLALLLEGMWRIIKYKRGETGKKELEERYYQAEKMKAVGTLAGGIARDFNNLLMAIQGHISMMEMDIDPSRPYYERLKSIEKQVQKGVDFTSRLFGYARKGIYEVKPIDLNKLIKETSDSFSKSKKEIVIYHKLEENLLPIEADIGQIEQVLMNMYENAADAMPDGGDLILKTFNIAHQDMKDRLYNLKPGNCVVLTITDTGKGMDKETMERIFDPFFTTKKIGRETGLGLASVYSIITAHGGHIDVESKEDRKTTFSIYFPASIKSVEKDERRFEQLIKGSGTVLLVDDEEVILEVNKDLLEAIGYQVIIARSGEEAIEVYKKNRDDIDMVLLDISMPGIGGGEAYDRLKEINSDIKVLLSTGFGIDGEANRILDRGCNGFIQKPFKMNELAGKINEILGRTKV
ncbi:MAG: GAF domain-containing protein [Proteobacteria bacterium]|nr:GAF domain-containing protein [Pseudomonadota bacterium]